MTKSKSNKLIDKIDKILRRPMYVYEAYDAKEEVLEIITAYRNSKLKKLRKVRGK